MCLILFSYNSHPRYKLVLVANRDEFFDRPTEPAAFWATRPDVLAGRDMVSGGTWLGVTKQGRFIGITNFRNPDAQPADPMSRGLVTRGFLEASNSAQDFIATTAKMRHRYQGFNLLVSHNALDSFHYYSNVSEEHQLITPGIHGLSNAFFNTEWPKVNYGKSMLRKTIDSNDFALYDLISIMTSREQAPESSLPSTGISLELEKKLSPVFISMKGYGTRCTTAIRLDYDNNLEFLEVSYNELAKETSTRKFQIKLNSR